MIQIAGLQKMTLLDYPGQIAATVFLGGCNFRCPFCHNGPLVLSPNDNNIPQEKVLEFLAKRQGLLDGVCITGGEPLMQKGLAQFISLVKDLGYLVKLDTNGSYPQRLKELVQNNLIDYVAMDIKNSPQKYSPTIGLKQDYLAEIEDSVRFLLTDQVDYEFRTTAVKDFHTEKDFKEIGQWIKGAKRYFLQNFTDSENLIQPGLKAFDTHELEEFARLLNQYVPTIIRND